MSNWGNGISLSSSSSLNTIFGNTVTSNTHGISLDSSTNNLIQNNVVNSNTAGGDGFGLYLRSSSDSNTILNNTLNSNNQGMYIDHSNSNIITNNTANSNGYAGFYIQSSTGSTFSGNTLTSNVNTGLFLLTTSGDTIYHNNIYSNSYLQIHSDSALEVSYNNEGNYWGRSSCPPFIPGNDSNSVDVVDSYPYASFNGWLSGGPANCCGGSIQCRCGSIVLDNTKLTSDLVCNGTALKMGADNIALDCNGYSLKGNGTGYGVFGLNQSSTIINCDVSGFGTGIYVQNVMVNETYMPSIINSKVHNNTDGISLVNSTAYINNTDFTDNQNATTKLSGLDVDAGSEVYLDHANFVDNGNYGINASGTVKWLLTKDAYCTNNNVLITSGWIIPFGGKIIPENCTVTVAGKTLDMSAGEQGYYPINVNTSVGNVDTVGSNDTGIEMEIHTTNGSSGTVAITFYNQSPSNASSVLTPFGSWIDAQVTGLSDLAYWILKIYYTDAQLHASGLSESQLRIQYYNASSGNWTVFNPPEGNVNTIDNYVWANITHFSTFGIFGSAPSHGSSGGGGGGGASGITVTWPDSADSLRLRAADSGSIVYFNVMNVGYSLTIPAISSTGASFEVGASLVTLLPGQKVGLDVNGDGIADISINVASVTSSSVDVLFERVSGAAQTAILPEMPTVTPPKEEVKTPVAATPKEEAKASAPEQKEVKAPAKTNWIGWLVAGIIIVCGLVTYTVVRRKKHTH